MQHPSYLLVYTIQNDKTNVDTDQFEVFADTTQEGKTPAQQAGERLKQLRRSEFFYSIEDGEITSWNICEIKKTSEHYHTLPDDLPYFYTPQSFEHWDCLEIHPVKEDSGNMEQCEDEDAHFYSVYSHKTGRGLECIADFPDKTTAEKFVETVNNLVKSFKP